MLKSPNNPVMPVTKPVPLTLFPTLDSVQDVLDLAESKLPISSKNEMVTLLGTYHNTLLHQLSS